MKLFQNFELIKIINKKHVKRVQQLFDIFNGVGVELMNIYLLADPEKLPDVREEWAEYDDSKLAAETSNDFLLNSEPDFWTLIFYSTYGVFMGILFLIFFSRKKNQNFVGKFLGQYDFGWFYTFYFEFMIEFLISSLTNILYGTENLKGFIFSITIVSLYVIGIIGGFFAVACSNFDFLSNDLKKYKVEEKKIEPINEFSKMGEKKEMKKREKFFTKKNSKEIISKEKKIDKESSITINKNFSKRGANNFECDLNELDQDNQIIIRSNSSMVPRSRKDSNWGDFSREGSDESQTSKNQISTRRNLIHNKKSNFSKKKNKSIEEIIEEKDQAKISPFKNLQSHSKLKKLERKKKFLKFFPLILYTSDFLKVLGLVLFKSYFCGQIVFLLIFQIIPILYLTLLLELLPFESISTNIFFWIRKIMNLIIYILLCWDNETAGLLIFVFLIMRIGLIGLEIVETILSGFYEFFFEKKKNVKFCLIKKVEGICSQKVQIEDLSVGKTNPRPKLTAEIRERVNQALQRNKKKIQNSVRRRNSGNDFAGFKISSPKRRSSFRGSRFASKNGPRNSNRAGQT